MPKWAFKSVSKLKKKIDKHGSKIGNETTTRYVLIDPVLRELGWCLDNPDEVEYEEGKDGRWDYNLRKRLLIEAKKLGGIKDKDKRQLIKYLRDNSMKHGVLTDGNEWTKWTISQDGEDVDFNIEVTRSSSTKIYEGLAALERDVIIRKIPEQESSTFEEPDNDVSIAKFRPSGKPAVSLRCESNQPIKCGHWIDILVNVAKYLIDKDYIAKSDCPIYAGPKTAILNTSEYNQTGIKMRNYKEIRKGWFLNTNLNPIGIVTSTKKLIHYAELDMKDFKIKTNSAKINVAKSRSKPLEQYGREVSISEFGLNEKLPIKIICRNDPPKECHSYASILFEIANYLIDNGYIKTTDCPMPSGWKNPLVTTEKRPYEKGKVRYRECHNTFYINVNFNRPSVIKNTIWLIEKVGLAPRDFKIQ